MDIMDYKLPGDKKSKKKKKPTLRFELDLPSSTDQSCPEYSYIELVRKTLKERESKGQNDDLCQNLLEEEEEKERNEAKAIAEYYEVKYGATAAGQKRKRKDKGRDLVGAGYGYDENDPFVDDSEAYDEIVPASLTTQHGGFYINIGKLNFRTVSDDSDSGGTSSDDSIPLAHHVGKKKKAVHALDSDESGNEFQSTDGVKKKKKKMKQAKDPTAKKRKMSLNGKDKVSELKQRAKKMKNPTSLAQKLVAKAKAQQMMNASGVGSPAHPSNGAIPQFRKLSEDRSTVKTGELGYLENKDLAQVAKEMTKELMNVGSDSSKVSPESDRKLQNGIISGTTSSSGSKNSSTINYELPPNLPQKLGDKIETLKKIAKSNEVAGKMKFFSSDVNKILLGIEESAQGLRNKERQGMYQHIAQHLPCSKDTLLKRVKKIQEDDSDQQLKGPIQKLKAAVDAVMTSQIQAYVMACDAKSEKFPPDKAAASTDEDEENEERNADGTAGEKAKRTYAPRRKFNWDDKLRKLLCDVVSVKMNLYERFKLREKLNAEEYLKAFLESSIKPLWPKPWMQTRILFKESRSAHERLTLNCQKPKKAGSNKKVPNANKDASKASESSSSQRVVTTSQMSAGQNDTPTKVLKKLDFDPPDTPNQSPASTSKQSCGIIDLTAGGGFELVASIEGDDFPSKKKSIISQSKGAARTTPKEIQTSWKFASSNSKAKNLQKQTPLPSSSATAGKTAATAGKTDPKAISPNSNKTAENFPPIDLKLVQDYASDFVKLMMSPGQGLQGSPGYYGMPGPPNYDAISKILGLKPDDVKPKNSSKTSEKESDGKFKFKISQSPSIPAAKGGFQMPDIPHVQPTLDPSTWVGHKAATQKVFTEEDPVKSLNSSSQMSPGISASSFGNGHHSKHPPVQSSPSSFASHSGSSKFTNQRHKKSVVPTNVQSPKNTQLNFEATAQIQKLATNAPSSGPNKLGSPLPHSGSHSPYASSQSVQSSKQISPLPGMHSMGLPPRSGQFSPVPGNSYSAPFTRPTYPLASNFKTPQSPVRTYPSSPMAMTGHPYGSPVFTTFPQVQLVDVQRNKSHMKQPNLKMQGNQSR